MTSTHDVVFLFDVDNTRLANAQPFAGLRGLLDRRHSIERIGALPHADFGSLLTLQES